MNNRARSLLLGLAVSACVALPAAAQSDPPLLDRARKLLADGNPKQAFVELAAAQSRLSGTPEFDYLLGVSALDSNRFEDAIIAFERVLAINPNHAGAQMDLGRAYFGLGSFDLAEAAFRSLKAQNPPPQALQAINQYLEAIQTRKGESRPGWTGFAELSIGYDSNLTGVPGDFGAAAQQSFNITVDPTGNSIKRSEAYFEALGSLEYSHPLGRGWGVFAGFGGRGRGYHRESDFNILAGDVRAGAFLNAGPTQWRLSAGYQDYNQDGAAPTTTGQARITNDRETSNVSLEWKRLLDTRTQVGLGLIYSQVRFPTNPIDDFDQVYLGASLLRGFEGRGTPLLYLTGFISDDDAKNTFDDGVTTKSKNLAGLRSYFQYSLSPKLQVFNTLGFVYRKDKDAFARSTTVEKGKDTFAEFGLGLTWMFRDKCAVRAQWSYTQNESNIDIYDFNRNEVSTAVRCDLF